MIRVALHDGSSTYYVVHSGDGIDLYNVERRTSPPRQTGVTQQVWHATHPALSTLDRLDSTRLYPGGRDAFATALVPASAAGNERLIGRLRRTSAPCHHPCRARRRLVCRGRRR
jgi:predicted transcriptional regulator of viral defense system